jgi:AAA+ ATPase superfamily predicted ATPase
MFFGRKAELNQLNALYDSTRFECVIIYGRRRVGKTTLINEFIKGKEAVYFTGLETSGRENLENLSRSILELRFGNDSSSPVFPSFQSAFDSVCEMAKEKRIVLVIDEYPYLAASFQGMSSLLQILIDQKFKNSNLMLILCGSSMSFMENQVLGYQSPLYGRRTAQFKILPFDFFETKAFFTSFDRTDLATVYGITGGVPWYLAQIKEECSLEDNIKQSFFNPSAYLFEEPLNLLKQEVREPAHYNAIIKAIATGSSKNSEISSKVDLESSACISFLKNLISLGIVKKETPMANKSTKKTIYSIEDNLFRFWYRFVPDNMALIQHGMIDVVWKKVEAQLPAFMGKVFEDICRQYLWRENSNGRLPFVFEDIGRWWGNDPVSKCEAEIDILAYSGENEALFGECKWTNEQTDTSVLNTLIARSELFQYPQKYLYLFAKTGFTSGCIQKAKDLGNVVLIDFADMNLA